MKATPNEVTRKHKSETKCANMIGRSSVNPALFSRSADILLRASQSKINEASGEQSSAMSYWISFLY